MYNNDTRSVRQQSNFIRYLHNESLTHTEMSRVLQQIQGIFFSFKNYKIEHNSHIGPFNSIPSPPPPPPTPPTQVKVYHIPQGKYTYEGAI